MSASLLQELRGPSGRGPGRISGPRMPSKRPVARLDVADFAASEFHAPERISELIGALYAGLGARGAPGAALEALSGALRAEAAVLGQRDELGMMVSAGANAVLTGLLLSQDPLGPLGADQIACRAEIVLPLGCLHAMGADLRLEDGSECRVRLARPAQAAPFGAAERGLFGMVLPHLRRALAVQARIEQMEGEQQIYVSALDRLQLGALVLDERGQVLRATPVAEQMLGARDGMQLMAGRPHAAFPAEDRDLQMLINDALGRRGAGPRALALSRPSGARSLGLVVQPLAAAEPGRAGRAAAVIFMRDPDGRAPVGHEILRELFDLTPAESAVALRLAGGASLEEAAGELVISRNTARAHLRSIFSKTGITRQTELVRMLLNSVAALGCKALPGAAAPGLKP